MLPAHWMFTIPLYWCQNIHHFTSLASYSSLPTFHTNHVFIIIPHKWQVCICLNPGHLFIPPRLPFLQTDFFWLHSNFINCLKEHISAPNHKCNMKLVWHYHNKACPLLFSNIRNINCVGHIINNTYNAHKLGKENIFSTQSATSTVTKGWFTHGMPCVNSHMPCLATPLPCSNSAVWQPEISKLLAQQSDRSSFL